MDEKYVVFKRDQFYRWVTAADVPVDHSIILNDAIVIRRQDPFAAAGLRGYSGAVLTALETIDIIGYPSVEIRKRLTELADYFMDEAAAAEIQSRGRFPD